MVLETKSDGNTNLFVSLIWAQSKNNVIGKNNTLPWHVSEDLQKFKELTSDSPMIMGLNTWLSLPGVLPGRPHIVLNPDADHCDSSEKVTFVKTIQEALNLAKDIVDNSDRKDKWANFVWVIGGQNVLQQFLDQKLADFVHLTELDLEVEDGDVFAPVIHDEHYRLLNHEDDEKWLTSKSGVDYRFRQYASRDLFN